MFGSRKFTKAYGENPATGKQKQYLRTLGYKPKKGLTLAKASKKIDNLLAAERKSGLRCNHFQGTQIR